MSTTSADAAKATPPAYRIVTPRLVLRPWSPTDAPAMAAAMVACADHLRPFMPWINEPQDVESIFQRFRKFRSEFDAGTNLIYAIFSADESEILGGTGLHTRVGADALEIGYWIHAGHVRRGFATEAAAALTRVAFEVHGVHRVDIHHDPSNVQSEGIPRSLGYVKEATLRARLPMNYGRYPDAVVWTMLREEYDRLPVRETSVDARDGMGRRLL
jgi:RimJ/RimL family protein N-acetyltransferase